MSKQPTDEKGITSRANDSVDALVIRSVFPEANAVFTAQPIPISEAKDAACIVLDTNALLVPYGIGQETLTQIESTYKCLLDQKRLVIPAQVAREFARNRVVKLAELHQKLARRRDQLQTFQHGSYPLLENLGEYVQLRKLEEQLDQLIGQYRTLVSKVIDEVRAWEWNDPVSLLYHKLFSSESVVETTKTEEDIKKDHAFRFANKLPPGYKDQSEDDNGIGDVMIWLTILELGTQRKTSVIFVSGEEKPDWWHRSENRTLYPRFELVDEYRRASGGKSFHVIKFSRLLELFGASGSVLAEVRSEEDAQASSVPMSAHSALRSKAILAERSVALWLRKKGLEIVQAPPESRWDYLVVDPAGPMYVEVAYVRSKYNVFQRISVARRHAAQSNLPLHLFIVCENTESLEIAQLIAAESPAPQLSITIGHMTSDGKFVPLGRE